MIPEDKKNILFSAYKIAKDKRTTLNTVRQFVDEEHISNLAITSIAAETTVQLLERVFEVLDINPNE